MSAYIVNDIQIDVIVSWFVDYRKDNQLWYEMNGKYGYMDKEAAPRVAECLYNQNVRSVNDRYKEQQDNEQYEFKYITYVNRRYNLAEIAGALDNLEYQSCETDDFYTTDAYKIITLMRKELLKQVQTEMLGDNIAWGIDELQDKPRNKEVADYSAYNVD